MVHRFLDALWGTAAELAPSLFLGLAVAGLLHVLVKKDAVFRHIGKPGFASTLKAALFGVPLPLCSCGVLPAAMALRKSGASRGATVSFLASTPQTGVDSVAVAWAMLGWPIALTKVLAALVSGVLSGTLVDRFAHKTSSPQEADTCRGPVRGAPVLRAWRYAFHTILGDIWGWLLLGIGVSALIFTLADPGRFAEYPALQGFGGLLAALVLGLPLYVCSVASVPIAAALIYAGFPVGSALVFLLAGPATNAATMGALRKILGKGALLSYLVGLVAVSLGAGLLLNNLSPSIHAVSTVGGCGDVPVWKQAAGGLLFAGILYHGLARLRKG